VRFSRRDNNPNTQGTEQRKYRILSLFLENGSGQKGMEEEEENFDDVLGASRISSIEFGRMGMKTPCHTNGLNIGNKDNLFVHLTTKENVKNDINHF
jgi:hypothetical protein